VYQRALELLVPNPRMPGAWATTSNGTSAHHRSSVSAACG
jgi:hypothetical protein